MMFMAIDGAIRNMGKPNCVSVGAVFMRNDQDFVDNAVVYEKDSTSQRGEMQALELALLIALKGGDKNLYILTDSEYLFNTVNKEWYKNWRRKGWVTAKDEQVKNRDIWERIAGLMDRIEDEDYEFVMYHIKGHLVSIGKVTAAKSLDKDELGIDLYKIAEDKFIEQSLRYEDKRNRALELFERNHGFKIPEHVFKRFVLMNTTVDMIAGTYADQLSSGDAAQ